MINNANKNKILVAGNPKYGLAQSLKFEFPHAEFLSRSFNGCDLSDSQTQKQVAERSLNYDVFISCSCLFGFHQTLLLKLVIDQWIVNSHKGHAIVLGSTADTPIKGNSKLYPIEKKALRSFCRNLSFIATGTSDHPPPGFRITYLSVGYLNTPGMNKNAPKEKKLPLDYITSVIKWIIEQPQSVNIDEICIDPIQETFT